MYRKAKETDLRLTEVDWSIHAKIANKTGIFGDDFRTHAELLDDDQLQCLPCVRGVPGIELIAKGRVVMRKHDLRQAAIRRE